MQRRYEHEVKHLASSQPRYPGCNPHQQYHSSRFHCVVDASSSSSSSYIAADDYLRFLDLFYSVTLSTSVTPLATPLLPSTASWHVEGLLGSTVDEGRVDVRRGVSGGGGDSKYNVPTRVRPLLRVEGKPDPFSLQTRPPDMPAADGDDSDLACVSAIYPPDYAIACQINQSTTGGGDGRWAGLREIERRLRWLHGRLATSSSSHARPSTPATTHATIRCPVDVDQLCYALRVNQLMNPCLAVTPPLVDDTPPAHATFVSTPTRAFHAPSTPGVSRYTPPDNSTSNTFASSTFLITPTTAALRSSAEKPPISPLTSVDLTRRSLTSIDQMLARKSLTSSDLRRMFQSQNNEHSDNVSFGNNFNFYTTTSIFTF